MKWNVQMAETWSLRTNFLFRKESTLEENAPKIENGEHWNLEIPFLLNFIPLSWHSRPKVCNSNIWCCATELSSDISTSVLPES
jgi:hypothetical protein